MAVIGVTRSSPGVNIQKFFWETLTSDDTATAVQPNGRVSGSIQVTGDFGINAVCALQGTNDGTNWADLNDLAGTAISLSAAGVQCFQDINVLQIRPNVTAGTAEDLDVTIILRE
jgi:hypothetical protein